MSASIRTTIIRDGVPLVETYTDTSPEVARKGDLIVCEAADPGPHTTFSWSLVFTPDSPNGTESTAGLENPPGSGGQSCQFTVDHEGAYLVRLVVDAGLPSEQARFVRVRYQTLFGDVRLVAAGERRDSVGVIPYDLTTEGWANQQNQNLQKLLAYVRRLSTSGRVLYVDANRGRHPWDASQERNNEDNQVHLPGTDAANLAVSGIITGAEGFADFSTINEAIAYAHQCNSRGEAELTPDSPYYIVIFPGLYIEDVVFEENVHLIGLHAPERHKRGVVVRTANTVKSHIFVGNSDSDQVFCENITFENVNAASDQPVVQVRRGEMHFRGCRIRQTTGLGTCALQVFNTTDGHQASAALQDSLVENLILDPNMFAIRAGSPGGFLEIQNSHISGASGIRANGDFGHGIQESFRIHLINSGVEVNHAQGYGLWSSASSSVLTDSVINGRDLDKTLVVDTAGGGKQGDLNVILNQANLGSANVVVDTTDVVGVSSLDISSSIYAGFTFPAAPPTLNSLAQAKSIHHQNNYADPFNGGAVAVPVPHQLGAENVQDAVDDLTVLATPLSASTDGSIVFMGLDGAYDAFTSVNPPLPGSGAGRRIVADSGPVQIIQAAAPDLPGVSVGSGAGNKNGHLQVEGAVEVGALDASEIKLDPNPFLTGPFIKMGKSIWPSDIIPCGAGLTDHRSLPAATIHARAVEGDNHNYNMRVQTRSTSQASNGSVGWLVLRAGDSLEKVGLGPHAAGVYIQAGSYLNDEASVGDNCSSGNVFLAPGSTNSDAVAVGEKSSGWVRVVDLSGATPARLVAQGAPGAFGAGAGQTEVAGKVVIATPMGHVKVSIEAGWDIAAVVNAFNNPDEGSGLIVASDDGFGKLALQTTDGGPLADLVYVFDEPTGAGVPNDVCKTVGNLRVASGNGAGPYATYAHGAYDSFINMRASQHGKLVIGEGGGVGPMSYDANTGKLTVPGAIDPTCMVFTEVDHTVADGAGTVGGVHTGPDEGAIFVSNGGGGLIDNGLYFRKENDQPPTPILTGSGAEGQVAVWGADGNTITGFPQLTWNEITGLSFDMDSASMIRVIDNDVVGVEADPQVQLLDKADGPDAQPVLQAAWGFLTPNSTDVSVQNYHDPGHINLVTTNGNIVVPNGSVHVESGWLGIGTNAPENPLHIVAGNDEFDGIKLDRDGGGTILIRNTATGQGFQISESNGYGGISHGGTETLTMKDGNVGIGAGANPQNPLHIVSDVGDAVKIDRAGGVNLVLRNTADGTGFQITNGGLFGQISHGGSPTIWLKDGNVGVGAAAPAAERLEVSGAVTVADSAAADSAEGTVRYSGGDFQGRTGAGWQSLTSGAVETVHTGIAWDDTAFVTDLNDAMYLNASYVGVDFTGAAAAGDDHTVRLPDTLANGARLGRRIYIKDETPTGFQTASGGLAGFEVSSGGAELEGLVGTSELTEDNQSFLVMCVDDGSVTGTAKWFIV